MSLKVVNEREHRVMFPRLEEPRDRERGRHLRVGQVSYHSERARYA
jgi:hypothetical protein